MSCIRDYWRTRETARTRRARLSSRAMLKLLVRVTGRIETVAREARARLDPTGGAEAPTA